MSFQKFPEKSPLSVSYRIIHVGEGCQQYVTDTVPLMYNGQRVIQIQPQRVCQIPGCPVSVRAQEEVRETHMLHTHPAIHPPTHTYTQQCIYTGFTLHGEEKVKGLSPLKNILPHVSKGEVNTYTISHTEANAEEKGCMKPEIQSQSLHPC